MAIETKDLVIYKSERLTDNSDGGGKYSGVVVQDGISNNLFNDVSEMDRTMGDVSMRKVFPAVTTEDTDLLMGATVLYLSCQKIQTYQHCFSVPKTGLMNASLPRTGWKTI